MGRTDGASTQVGASGAGCRWPDRLRWTCWSANWRGGSTLDCMMRCAAPAPADSQATAVTVGFGRGECNWGSVLSSAFKGSRVEWSAARCGSGRAGFVTQVLTRMSAAPTLSKADLIVEIAGIPPPTYTRAHALPRAPSPMRTLVEASHGPTPADHCPSGGHACGHCVQCRTSVCRTEHSQGKPRG